MKPLHIRGVHISGAGYDFIMNIEAVNQVQARTDIVVIGTNSEMADYDNPRGEIHGYRGYVFAEAPDGSRWEFHRTLTLQIESEVFDRLNSFVAFVQKKLDRGVRLNPKLWTEVRPGYGSDAYVAGNWSEIDYLEERMNESQW